MNMNELTKQQRNLRALIYGILIGVYYCLLILWMNSAVDNMAKYKAIRIGGYFGFLGLLAAFGILMRKNNGGLMDFRKTFGAIIIMILVSELIYFICNYVQTASHPEMVARFNNAYLNALRAQHMRPGYVDSTSVQLQQQVEQSRHFSLSNNIVSFFSGVVADCFPAIIISFLIRKDKPKQQ